MKMIKKSYLGSLIIVSLVLAQSAFAGFNTKFTVASDYVWRGTTLSSHGAAVQGGFNYDHESGLGVGTWVSNVTAALGNGVENKVYGNFNHAVNDDLNVGVEAMWYNYPATSIGSHYWNWTEFSLHASWQKMVELGIYHASKYRRTDSSSTYYNLGVNLDIVSDFSLGLGLGMTSYGDEIKVGVKNHMDYRVSLGRTHEGTNITLNWTSTNRKSKTATTETKLKDDSLFIAAARSF